MEDSNQEEILHRLRHVLRNHALTMRLSKQDQAEVITMLDIINLLKQINPTAQHQEKTWKAYAERMGQWLYVTGYLVQRENDWKFADQGKVNLEIINKTRRGRKTDGVHIFIGDTSPAKTLEALDYLRNNQPRSNKEMEEKGFRNAVVVLRSLKVVKNEFGKYSTVEPTEFDSNSSLEILWDAVCGERTVQLVIDYLKKHPTADGKAIGRFLNLKFKREWSPSSETRTGNSLYQWASWILIGKYEGKIPKPPGRMQTESRDQLDLFQGE